MYIIKNAMKSISRSKTRNILIGIIVLVIAVSACIALSIRESAAKARAESEASLKITAQISLDRNSLMKNFEESGSSGRETMKEGLMGETSLSLDEMQEYASCSSVTDFYYSISTSVSAGSEIEPIDSTGTFSRDSSNSGDSSGGMREGFPGGMEGGNNSFSRMGNQGDFTIVGYSSDVAMTDFVSGTCSITDGSMFEEGTSEKVCVISDELAAYNSVSTGDTVTFLNPNAESEEIAFTVIGIYHNDMASASEESGGMRGFSTASDSSNYIYTSYNLLKTIIDSYSAAETDGESSDSSETSTALRTQVSGTYVFSNAESYENFEAEAREMGLEEKYAVSSSDYSTFESSMLPLENLSKTATYFLIVVLCIGAVILIVLNIFNIRERKYEVGVLTAVGMKKQKVALQFLCELFIITFISVLIGSVVGAVSSVPVTNALLSSQIESVQASSSNVEGNFGRGTSAGQGKTGMAGNIPGGDSGAPEMGGQRGGFFSGMAGNTVNYVSEISYSTDISVLLQLMGIGLLLTVISSLAAVLFIMRYEPLKILSNRD